MDPELSGMEMRLKGGGAMGNFCARKIFSTQKFGGCGLGLDGLDYLEYRISASYFYKWLHFSDNRVICLYQNCSANRFCNQVTDPCLRACSSNPLFYQRPGRDQWGAQGLAAHPFTAVLMDVPRARARDRSLPDGTLHRPTSVQAIIHFHSATLFYVILAQPASNRSDFFSGFII